mgnify:CR=1 FL=1
MSYGHLGLHERPFIYHFTLIGLAHREIGRRPGRYRTTIGREVRRHGAVDDDVYCPESAHWRAAYSGHPAKSSQWQQVVRFQPESAGFFIGGLARPGRRKFRSLQEISGPYPPSPATRKAAST